MISIPVIPSDVVIMSSLTFYIYVLYPLSSGIFVCFCFFFLQILLVVHLGLHSYWKFSYKEIKLTVGYSDGGKIMRRGRGLVIQGHMPRQPGFRLRKLVVITCY